MKKPIVFMYSGQGAQYYGMGADLYETQPIFKKAMDECSDIVQPLLGQSLAQMIYTPREKKYEGFDQTRFTHPANVAFCYSLTQYLISRGLRPDYVMGYSLGEYAAAVVSGVVALEPGLRNITQQALKLEELTPRASMMAIVTDIQVMKDRPDLFTNVTLAAHNFANHFVVTGTHAELERIKAALDEDDVTSQILPISVGFHSHLVDPVADWTRDNFRWYGTQQIPFISSLKKGRVYGLDGAHFWSAIRETVWFMETAANLEAGGKYHYVDCGPAGTLATFMKYLLPRNGASKAHTTVNQFGRNMQNIDKVLGELL